MLLANVNSPADIKNLSPKEVYDLADEIRRLIIKTVAHNGGHLASNLGVVELTLALHRVFSSPDDAIVWDVSHQCYAHKILTGRCKNFETLRLAGGLSGFAKKEESEHDFFDNGHASTSISQALGLLKAREILGVGSAGFAGQAGVHGAGGDREGGGSQKSADAKKVIAVIGDGALTGGLAYEAILNAGKHGSNLIIILNDNQMSISPNEGTLSRYLSRLTMGSPYQSIRHGIDGIVEKMPFSRVLKKMIFRLKRGLKGFFLTNNLFVDFGFEYVGPLNGHDIRALEATFAQVKRLTRPVVVHVLTKKGKGYSPAEDNPEMFHGIGHFNISDGSAEKFYEKSFTEFFSSALVEIAARDERIVGITASMAKGTGLSPFERKFPERFFDVGIAEEHAVTFASGLSRGGMIPVVCIYSTFIQRAVDQIIHDVAIQGAHIVLVLDRSGAVPYDGETHQGIFDIALLKNIPRVVFMSPASGAELELLLGYAIGCDGLAVIRYPKKTSPSELPQFVCEVQSGRGVLVDCETISPSLSQRFDLETGKIDDSASSKDGQAFERILIVTLGSMFSESLVAARMLLLADVFTEIYNLRFVRPLDIEYFCEICSKYDGVVIVEDGIRSGGIAEELKAALFERRCFSVGALAFPEAFPSHGSREEILEGAYLSPNDIHKEALGLLNQRRLK